MSNNQKLLNLISIGLVLLQTTPSIAQSTFDSSNKIDTISFIPPSDQKQPQGSTSAGRRAPFDSGKKSLIALVPKTNIGLTLEERPTFWVYIPETSAKQVILCIQDQDNQHHSQTEFSITGTSGIISLKPSDDTPPLEVGKTYKWSVVLVRGEKLSPDDPGISSWVERVNLGQSLNSKTTLEQADWYGKQGIWYNLLDTLVKARSFQPDNKELKDMWIEFLNSVGLQEISTEPLQF